MAANPHLTGNFAPVREECTATGLPVTGDLPPPALDGRLPRIGPNPVGPVDPATHHWLLGTGMVHGVRLRSTRWRGASSPSPATCPTRSTRSTPPTDRSWSTSSAEDDGWVLAYVHDAGRDACDVIVLDAQDFAAPPLATVHLPVRVPVGFHGNWVPAP